MADKKPSTLRIAGGFFEGIGLRAKLILRLMLDRRVSWWLKLLPVGSLVYLVNPIDIPGPIDDIAVVSLGFYLFVELCPPAVVKEHMDNLKSVVDAKVFDPNTEPEGEVIDAEFHEAPKEHASQKP